MEKQKSYKSLKKKGLLYFLMGCDDGSGNCYTRDLYGRIIRLSEGNNITYEGRKHLKDFKDKIEEEEKRGEDLSKDKEPL